MFGTCFLLSLVIVVQADMESYIVGGSFVSITKYPHSAYLIIGCVNSKECTKYWKCGASVLNQQLLLTAGHCLESCSDGREHIIAHFGDDHKKKGVIRSTNRFVLHENYSHTLNSLSHDIALIKLHRPVDFDSKISRVAIMKNPPYNETAYVAGWGVVDTQTSTLQNFLKHIDQNVKTHAACLNLAEIPRGTICATNEDEHFYAAAGDSGSALVVRDYIQIGLVSYKIPEVGENFVIYTDVGFYYDWIAFNAEKLYCHNALN